ncbi:enoyl-CoA hydratase/isomerase family protein [Calditerrivibrio nitroreducens]|uniref:enoyl-CoA hydratase/isomerase family protein n=1 Tax=Calditerrivibrio nitroreducens TaxID=477976 RepID=UPI003C7693D2
MNIGTEINSQEKALYITFSGIYLTKNNIVEIINLIESVENDKNINHIIFSSASKDFCLGHDIKSLLGYDETEAKIYASLGQELIKKIRESRKIIISALAGKTLGPGFEIAIASDLVFATKDTTFGFPETDYGIIPAFGGTALASRKIHENFVKYLTITGVEIGVDELFCRGIISKIFKSKDEMFGHICDVVKNLNKKSMFTLGLAKETINNGIEIDIDRALLLKQNAFSVAFSSYDKKEGMLAFIEKREPKFKNRWEDYEDMF